jgi:ZIP family zinc transporter
VAEALLWGAGAAAALVVGALAAELLRPGRRANGVILALGAGLLLGAVSLSLVVDALAAGNLGTVAVALMVGALTFVAGDWMLDRRGAAARKDPGGAQAMGAPQAIVLGTVLDGIPESLVLGLTVLQGSVGVPLLAGIALSNLSEGMASSGVRPPADFAACSGRGVCWWSWRGSRLSLATSCSTMHRAAWSRP